MTTEPLVTIIIDNYNYGRFLGAAIDSALAQTYANTEVIVVDDGSTDASRDIIAGYGDRVIPLFKDNGGQASAFNLGFARSQGEYVIFLDADDILLPQTVARVVETFRTHPDTAKVQYRMEIIDATARRTGHLLPHPYQPMPNGHLEQHVMRFPADLAWMGTSGNAFAARVLRCILPIPEQDFQILADYYLCHLAPLFGPIVSLEAVGALYRIHGSNVYSSHRLNLRSIRNSLIHWSKTSIYITEYANRLKLAGRPRQASDVLSVAHLINRFISLKLDPKHHPIAEDSLRRLLTLGIVASTRRFDVSLPMKLLYILWFTAMVLAPERLAWWLAEQAMFPERRGALNKLLHTFQSRPGISEDAEPVADKRGMEQSATLVK